MVEAVGGGVGGFRAGAGVAYCLSWGSYAEHAVVAAWRVVHVSNGLPLDLAAASVFQGLTAHYPAYDLGSFGPGATCLVFGASSGMVRLLVQLGAWLGATVYAVTSTEAKAQAACDHGAAAAFLYDIGRFADMARSLTDGRVIDVVFDAIGEPTLRDSMRAARTKGLVVNFGSVGGTVGDLDPIELGEAGSLFLARPRPADYLQNAEAIRRRAAGTFEALTGGALLIGIAGRYTIDTVDQVHRRLEHGGTADKMFVEIAGTI